MAKTGYCRECQKHVWQRENGSWLCGHPAESVINVDEAEPSRVLIHSSLGIASFIVSLGNAIFFTGTFVVAFILANTTPLAGQLLLPYPAPQTLALVITLSIFISTVGFALGIAGLFQKDRKRVFATLGSIFNIVIIILVIFLTLIGLFTGFAFMIVGN